MPRTIQKCEQAIIDAADCDIDPGTRIDCSGCRLCIADCPLDLRIPDLISLYNYYLEHKTASNLDFSYRWLTWDTGKASDCAGCRVCEGSCASNVRIAETIRKISVLFD